MRFSIYFLITIVFISVFLSSCTRRVLDFTLISSKNVDLSKGASFIRGKSRVSGKDKIHIIIFIPTGQINIKEAVDKAIESTPGCVALLDGVIYTKSWWIPYIYGQSSATIEGLPLIDPSLVLGLNQTPNYLKVQLGNNGSIQNVEELSSTEYYNYKNRLFKESEITRFTRSDEIR